MSGDGSKQHSCCIPLKHRVDRHSHRVRFVPQVPSSRSKPDSFRLLSRRARLATIATDGNSSRMAVVECSAWHGLSDPSEHFVLDSRSILPLTCRPFPTHLLLTHAASLCSRIAHMPQGAPHMSSTRAAHRLRVCGTWAACGRRVEGMRVAPDLNEWGCRAAAFLRRSGVRLGRRWGEVPPGEREC